MAIKEAAQDPSVLFAAPIKGAYRQPNMRKLQNNIKSMLMRRRSLEKTPLMDLDERRDPDFVETPSNHGFRRLVTSIKARLRVMPKSSKKSKHEVMPKSSKKSKHDLILTTTQFSESSSAWGFEGEKLYAGYDVQVSQCLDSAFGDDFDDHTPLLGVNSGGKSTGLKKQASKVKSTLARKLSRGLGRVYLH